jgi:hypothetical protein
MSGGVRNVFVENVDSPSAGSVIGFKSNLDRGAAIRDVVIQNISGGQSKTFLEFTNNYHSWRGGHFPTLFQNITVTGARGRATGLGISAVGLPDKPLTDIFIRELTIKQAGTPIKLNHTSNFVLVGVTMNGKQVTNETAL